MSETNILIAEDDKMLGKIISLFFKQNTEWKVELVENGEEALKKLTVKDYNLLLTDLNMPILDGYKLIEKIEKHKINIPIIIMTAEKFDNDQYVEYVNINVKGYIEKPLKKDILSFLEQVIIDYKENL